MGLPAAEIPLSLFSFNVGIELGQLAFIAVLLALRAVLVRSPLGRLRFASAVPAYAIGSLAVFWSIERVMGW